MPGTLRSISLASFVALAVMACSGSGATTAPPTSTVAPSTAVASGAVASSAVTARVSANDASREELVAALTAAGVPNADRWAREIEEYRPYDTSDATLQKLQDNLAKYDPDAATLAAILSALQP